MLGPCAWYFQQETEKAQLPHSLSMRRETSGMSGMVMAAIGTYQAPMNRELSFRSGS
jgi:hypothetical protein